MTIAEKVSSSGQLVDVRVASFTGLIVTPDKPEGMFDEERNNCINRFESSLILSTDFSPESWGIAADRVRRFASWPRYMWNLIHETVAAPVPPHGVTPAVLAPFRRLAKAIEMDEDLKQYSGYDLVGACAFLAFVSREVKRSEYKMLLGPLWDDALIDFHLGMKFAEDLNSNGFGRGALAGLAIRLGIACQICTAESEEVSKFIFKSSEGKGLQDVAREVFSSDPCQVSSLIFASSGCGRDAVDGCLNMSSAREGGKNWSYIQNLISEIRINKNTVAVTDKLSAIRDITRQGPTPLVRLIASW